MITKNNNNVNNKIPLDETEFKVKKLMTNDIVIKLDDCNFTKYSQNVLKCGSYLLFSVQEHISTKEHRKRLKEANFCRFKFCPMCAWRKARNLSGQLLQALEAIQSEKEVECIFLTLTIKNPPINQLKKAVKHMNEAFQRMTQTKKYKQAVLGHLKSLEILGDNTPVGEAHPHFHCLLVVDKKYFKSRYYIKQGEWQEMWKKALRVDYAPSVDVRKIRVKKNSNLTALQSAVFEVAKYAVKYTDLVVRPDDDFKFIINQTYRMRFYATAGILKDKINLKKVEEDLINLDENIEAEWIEIKEELYRWINSDYYLYKYDNEMK